ncbi:MAG: J domain-containing protein [Terracidiphilus sp.]|jgi:hypothetical protein
MKGHFQVGPGNCATSPAGYKAAPEAENHPRHVWRFVDDFQLLAGEDSEPDARFFIESWTIGTTAAVKSFQGRRQRRAEPEHPRDEFRESGSVDVPSPVQEKALSIEFIAAASASAVTGYSSAGQAPKSPEEEAARAQEQAWQEWERLAEEHDQGSGAILPMPLEQARRLLGVTAASTRKQIKAAYRRMVSQWHPDRLELGTEEVRQLATERMAAINEAYRLLVREQR